jgi:hypothetical protein
VEKRKTMRMMFKNMNLKKEKRNLKCDMSQKLKKSERFEM